MLPKISLYGDEVVMTFTEITDDLTGAVDSGSYFTARGQRLRIYTSPNASLERCSGELLSVNMSSRNILPELARKVHEDLTRHIPHERGDVFMKKIGTGFRGNDASELEGLLCGWPDFYVFIVDHAPDLGTFTLYGHQYCEGQILHKSLYAADPVMPPTESYIPDILSKGTDIPIGLVDIDKVKGGDLLAAVREQTENGRRIIVFDAITKDDTMRILCELMPVYPNVFWTGSLGIADGLAEHLFGSPLPQSQRQSRDIRSLCFTASGYEIVQKQIEYSRARGLQVITLDVDAWIDGDGNIPFNAVTEASQALKNSNVMVRPCVQKYSRRPGTNLRILACLGETAMRLCRQPAFDRLVIVGGETAQEIFARTDVASLRLGLPLGTGIAEGTIMDGPLAGREFAMKGGSMGTPSSLETMMCRGDEDGV